VLKNIFFWIALCWSGVVVFFCLTPSNHIPSVNLPNLDKLVHAFFHFVFTILWFLVLKKQVREKNQYQLIGVALIFSFLFGITIELLQERLTTTRSADFFDIMANIVGSFLALCFVFLSKKLKKTL
jgi:VanZ family protein